MRPQLTALYDCGVEGATDGPTPPRPLNEPGFAAWRNFLRAHSRLIRELDQRMRSEHDFTLGDFDGPDVVFAGKVGTGFDTALDDAREAAIARLFTHG